MDEAAAIQEQVEEGAPAWVVTFGDLMSLLLCFFVLMLSFSEMDRKKYRIVSGSMKKAFGIQRKTPVFESPKGQKIIAKEFDQAIATAKIEEEIIDPLRMALKGKYKDIEDHVEIEMTEKLVKISLMGQTTFDTGKADIRPRFWPLLREIASLLQRTNADIIIAGHTDNVPLQGGRFKSNLGLSSARAGSVAEYLLKHSLIQPQRVSTMGFGEYRPLAPNGTSAGRQKNRRVEIIISTDNLS